MTTAGAEPAAWVEPAARVPLRWGRYRDRHAMGLVLIVGGMVHLQAASTSHLWPLAIGTAAHIVGWLILPAAVWRRLVPVLPSGLVVWLLLTGPQAVWLVSITVLCWFIARHRPWRSYLALGPVLLYGVAAVTLFREYDGALVAQAGALVVAVGSAWWGWALARPAASIRRSSRSDDHTATP